MTFSTLRVCRTSARNANRRARGGVVDPRPYLVRRGRRIRLTGGVSYSDRDRLLDILLEVVSEPHD